MVVDVALTGAFRLTRAVLPGMIDAHWGRIVNLTGMNAIRGYVEGAPISAAKHGLLGMSKSIAREFAPHGITVNVVSPGQIRADSAAQDDPKRAAQIPAGVMGRPHDIAQSTCIILAHPFP